MSTETVGARPHRMTPIMRDGETVTPLELFFDLVFVLALTQCTALMAHEPTWSGLAKGMLVLGMLWWSWVGYAWLTSVIDPEEGAVRLVIFAAMAAMLVAALCVPEAFGHAGLVFAGAYAFVRIAHIGLFVLSSAEDEGLRKSVVGLAGSTTVSVGILTAAAFVDGTPQGVLWALALVLDMGGPALIGVEGWRLSAPHFAERHGLIVIIALGESIVAIGAGSGGIADIVDLGVITAAVLGTAIASALWWLYFDVVALVSARRLAEAPVGRVQNAIARDSYSFLHLPMVAGIALVAFGMKVTLGHVEDPLDIVPATALYGGTALYLLSHVAFRYRQIRTLNTRRLGLAVLLLALIEAGVRIPALASIAIVAALLAVLIVVETLAYGESRQRTRESLRHAGEH